jgi:hypothetical protein
MKLPLVLSIVCVVVFSACQEQQVGTPVTDKSALIGNWEEPKDAITLSIFKGGKIVYIDHFRKKQTTGRYSFDKDIIRVTYEGMEAEDYKAYISEEKLFLVPLKGTNVSQLRRVRDLSM